MKTPAAIKHIQRLRAEADRLGTEYEAIYDYTRHRGCDGDSNMRALAAARDAYHRAEAAWRRAIRE